MIDSFLSDRRPFSGRSVLRRFLLPSVFCIALVAGCTGIPGRTGDEMLKTEMYFGMNKGGGDSVTSAEWQAFVDTCITREFADGFTVINARGQWRSGSSAIERENSRVLILVHPDTEDADRRLEFVREIYKQAFRQESVLRVTAPVRASF